jgi:hypothetical protein
MKPDTFLLTLPDGQRVRCWRKDAQALRVDVALTGNVFLRRSPGSEVYERVVSQQIHRLEQQVGTTPYTRNSRLVELTDSGRARVNGGV